METIYNHVFTLAFTVTGSKCPDGNDLKPEQFAAAIEMRVSDLSKTHAWDEALDRPVDTYEEDPVEPNTRWVHRNGIEYEVIGIANADTVAPIKYPETVVYRGDNGKIWSRPLSDWHRSMRRKLV